MKDKFFWLQRLDSSIIIQSIRQGLVVAIPILMIGSFALVLKFLPIALYQNFLHTFLNGFFIWLFTIINQATFGILGVSMVVSISFCYAQQKTSSTVVQFGTIFTSLSSYMVFIGLFTDEFTVSSLAAQGMFTSVFCAVFSSTFFCLLATRERFQLRLYSIGADTTFNAAISMILPAMLVILVSLLLNGALSAFFHVAGFEQLFHTLVNDLFENIDSRVLRTLLFLLLINVFWFFGIHGSNVLESVARGLFSAEAVGGTTEILGKNFLDVFVLMGGCGTTISLLVAILIFSRKKNNRNLAKMAAFPMLFNINELVLFGLPIIFNFSLLLPFILTPFVCMGISYLAISIGLVPVPTVPVEWITPIIVGGYVSTGSIAGSILQLFNIGVGTAIYGFFLRRYERKTTAAAQQNLKELVRQMQEAEQMNRQLLLLDLPGGVGSIARMLAEDFKHVLAHSNSFSIYYQPQYNHKDVCVGAEALLRWNHPQFGIIYPPLLIGIANETKLLHQLEQQVLSLVSADISSLNSQAQLPAKLSVNVTASTLQSDEFYHFLTTLMQENCLLSGRLCLELTEQMSFSMNAPIEEHLELLRKQGIQFAIDDFSMGYTSLKYLQNNLFSVVKLDGSLIKDILKNPRSQEIISSIIHMSKSMDFLVVAEYVETIQQRDMLMELGCYCYQGYLYSPALPLEDFISFQRISRAPHLRHAGA